MHYVPLASSAMWSLPHLRERRMGLGGTSCAPPFTPPCKANSFTSNEKDYITYKPVLRLVVTTGDSISWEVVGALVGIPASWVAPQLISNSNNDLLYGFVIQSQHHYL